ncbi:hypothetical protein DNTS_003299 [Danionella cerebrum]|uniref:Carbonic anhydrase 4 n=1 Tax=Danionella cerebrum TaxID=2873325 RepID=A0A553MVL1_9TELE|nr:hypothetical protein DNTS_003299 [Danionella translucida]
MCWCYQSQVTCDSRCQGPNAWVNVNPSCGNNRQSPINIVTRKTKVDERLVPFKFSGYDNVFDTFVRNNGHTIQANIPILATISGGNLGETYKAVQLHLHWGTNGGPGSEHTLHIVHMKLRYNRIEDALRDPAGLAVLGFFYQESNSINKKYNQITNALSSIENIDGNTTLRRVSLGQYILPEESMYNYYRYYGSLTTPGCTEAVVWSVFEKAIPLHREQLKAFSNLKFPDGSPMVETFRPVQPRNGRTVYHSSSPPLASTAVLMLISVSTAFALTGLQ